MRQVLVLHGLLNGQRWWSNTVLQTSTRQLPTGASDKTTLQHRKYVESADMLSSSQSGEQEGDTGVLLPLLLVLQFLGRSCETVLLLLLDKLFTPRDRCSFSAL